MTTKKRSDVPVNAMSLNDIPNILVLGRTCECRAPLNLFWTGSGIEFIFTGAELWIDLFADFTSYESWISVELNGAWYLRMPLQKGENHICILRGMTVGDLKHVRIINDVQPMGEYAQNLQIVGMTCSEGEFLPLDEPKYRIEFIGDSITSGEGTIGAKKDYDWISMFFSGENNYARMAADALDSEFRIVSQCGWGVASSWDNNPFCTMPTVYDEICSVVSGEYFEKIGAKNPYNFESWPADAVVVNLGTNDEIALESPEWTSDDGKTKFCQRIVTLDNQTYDTTGHLRQAVIDFLIHIRKNNPHAQIVWAYEMFGSKLAPVIRGAVNDYKQIYQDDAVSYFKLPQTTPENIGSHQHPGKKAHEAAAHALTAYLKTVLNN